jgi:pyruvate/2-oxoglutarate dehydrogenase complex dihydrolipoamide dehydrogenase (E3) component
VTLVAGRILRREDTDVTGLVADVLAAQGVDLRLGARAGAVRQEQASGDVVVTLDDGSELLAQELLTATGRVPVTADLCLDAAGVELTDRGYIRVDEHLRTTADHVWAAGDAAGSPQYTHASWNDFRILRTNLTGGAAVTTGRLVPYTVFITPELARVGLTEAEARAQGRRVRVATLPVAAIPRARTRHDTIGSWKVVVDADTDRILGAALLGTDSGEVISVLQMAMLGGMPYQRVRDAIITHPTMGEGLNLLFDALDAIR